MDVTTLGAFILFALKVVVDANFGHKALKEVRSFKDAFIEKMKDHDHRISKLEVDTARIIKE